MTKYLLQSPDMPDRVLFVRRWSNATWVVGYLPIDPRKRFYPNLDFESSRRFFDVDWLGPCFSAEKMQRKLDAYAKKYGLEIYTEREETQ